MTTRRTRAPSPAVSASSIAQAYDERHHELRGNEEEDGDHREGDPRAIGSQVQQETRNHPAIEGTAEEFLVARHLSAHDGKNRFSDWPSPS